MVIPPDLLTKLNDCARNDFASARDLWFSRQWRFSASVIVGLVLEGPELWYEMLFIVRSRIQRFRYSIVIRERPVELAKMTALLGWIFIVVGLLGELRTGSKIADLSASIQGCSDAKVKEVTLEAGDAADSARTAHAELNAVKQEAAALQTRLNAASEQLGKVEKQVRTLEPRWQILADNKSDFIRDLKPFSGTRVTVLVCGGPVSPIEQMETEQRLLDLLGKSGANWVTGYQSWTTCIGTSSNGLEMVLNINAGEAAKKAGDALKDELLGFGIATSLDVVPRDRAKFMASGLGTDSPWGKAEQEPNTIFLLVAPNAMVESAQPSKKPAKTP